MELHRYPWEDAAAFAIGGSFLVLFIAIAVLSVGYPFQLEWMEGGTADVVARILAHKPLYVAPSIDYVPYVYAPLYYYVAALVSGVAGIEALLAARLVSLAAALGCGWLIYLIAARETGNRVLAACGAFLFFATFEVSGKWLYIGRVDSLNLLFLLIATYALRFGGRLPSAALAGLFLALAFWTKQSALLAAIPLLAAVVLLDWRRGLVAMCTGLAAVVAPAMALHVSSDGWSTYYLFDLVRQHDFEWRRLITFWPMLLLGKTAIAAALSFLALAILFVEQRRAAIFYAGLFAGFIGSAWAARLHNGSWSNVAIPAFAVFCILAPVGIVRIRALLGPRLEGLGGKRSVAAASGLLLVLQLLGLAYDPRTAIPNKDDRAAAQHFLDYLSAIDGPVLLPDLRFVPTMAGKDSYGLEMAARDVLRAGEDDRGRAMLMASMKQAIEARRFRAIIINEVAFNQLPELERYYRFTGRVFDDSSSFIPVAGWPTRPNLVFVPKDSDASSRAAAPHQ